MAFWDDLLDTVKDVAPTVALAAGTAAGGPVAGGVLAALARKLTESGPGRPLDEVAQDLLTDPVKLQEFRLRSRELELEELKIRTADVQDARKLAISTKGAAIISVVVVAGYLGAVASAMLTEIPAGSQNLAYLLLGNLGTGFGMVLTFWLGSSKGSKEKDDTMRMYVEAAVNDQRARRIGGEGAKS